MDAFGAEGLAELCLQHVVDRMDDKIHHLYGRVDDAEALGQDREGPFEETVIELVDQLLPPMSGDHIRCAPLHAGVELGEAVGFLGQIVLVELAKYDLHGARHGICLGKLTALEESVENGARDEMLCQHLNGFRLGDRGVQIVL